MLNRIRVSFAGFVRPLFIKKTQGLRIKTHDCRVISFLVTLAHIFPLKNYIFIGFSLLNGYTKALVKMQNRCLMRGTRSQIQVSKVMPSQPTVVRAGVSDMKKVAAKCLTAFLGLVDQGKQDVYVNIQSLGRIIDNRGRWQVAIPLNAARRSFSDTDF
jgi:hypothetical protein